MHNQQIQNRCLVSGGFTLQANQQSYKILRNLAIKFDEIYVGLTSINS